MKRNRNRLSLLAALLLAVSLAIPASAETDAGSGPSVEENETSIGGNLSMRVGDRRDLTGSILYGTMDEDAADQWYFVDTVRWSSSNPDIVSVSEKGVATAHRVGTARITATGWDNLARKHEQTVIIGVVSAGKAASGSAFRVYEGDRLDLRQLAENNTGGAPLTWASSNTGIAAVDKDGLVEANSVGRCTIKATYADAKGGEQTVKYTVQVSTITMQRLSQESTVIMNSGDRLDTGRLCYPNYQNLPGALSRLSCSTGDASITSVEGLVVTAKASGTTYITLRQDDGKEEQLCHTLKIIVRS